MNVSLRQLKVFVAVARERSFTRAAREFDLTQSAVSRCVSELEDAVELKLFDRTTRQVELTNAGASLERRIGRLLDEIDLTLREERAAYDGHTGVVVLASNPVLSSASVAQSVARCASALPGLIVSVRDQPQSSVLASVEQGEVDFGVVSLAEPLIGDVLHAQVIFTTPLHAVVPLAHPLARHDNVAWQALNEWALITLNADAGIRTVLELGFNANQLKRRSLQELGHVAAVARMVELGLDVGILPVDAHWPSSGNSLVSRPLVPQMSVVTQLVRRRNRSLRPSAAAVWAQFAALAGNSPSLVTDVAPSAPKTFRRPEVARGRTVLHEPKLQSRPAGLSDCTHLYPHSFTIDSPNISLKELHDGNGYRPQAP